MRSARGPAVVLVALLLSVLSLPVLGQDLGEFTELSPMPFSNAEFGAAAIGKLIYMVGGFTDESALLIYDTVADSWSRGADMPNGNHHPAVIAHGGRIYVFGGHETESLVQIYDPQSDSWTVATAEVPTPRRAMGVTKIGNKIHIMGGTDSPMGGGGLDAHDVYDPARDSFETLAPLLELTDHGYPGTIGGKIYLAGGRRGFVPKTKLQIYDPATDSWSYGAEMLMWASGHATQVVADRLYVFGGEDVINSRVSNVTQRYDPTTDSWQQLADLPTRLHAMASAVVGNSIYLFGGTTVVEPNSAGRVDVLRFDPPAVPVVLAPKRLKAKALPSERVRLKWKFKHKKSDASALELELRVGDGPFELLETLGTKAKKVIVADLEPAVTYTFRIRAVGPSGPSAWSNERTITLPE